MKLIHFVGIMSPSMASLAVMASLQGHRVTGSDDSFDGLIAAQLESKGVKLFDMFAQANINNPDLVVVSRFFDDRHSEVNAAKSSQVRTVSETEYLREVVGEQKIQAVLGNYEGPIIAAWLSYVYKLAGLPTTSLTSAITQNQSLAVTGTGEQFIIALSGMKRDWHTYEPDFLSFEPETVVIPSIMYDFPDLASTLDEVYQHYFTFAKRVGRTGVIIGNSDWSRMKRMRIHLADRRIETYGFDRDAMWQINDVSYQDSTSTFTLKNGRQLLGPFVIPMVGRHFISIVTAVIVTSIHNNISLHTIDQAIKSLPHVSRYLDESSDKLGRVFIDDCADNPATIEDILLLVKQRFPDRKIWCLYQSGSFLRSKSLQSEYESVFEMADHLYLADIKGMPKEKSEGIHARHLVAHMRELKPQTYYIESAEETARLLAERIPSSDCIVTLGAPGVCQEITERIKTLS